MKIAITASGAGLDSEIDPRFGRCSYFIVYDTEQDKFEVVENSNIRGMGGVGIQSAQLMADQNVQAVITGNCGPNAFRTLKAANIQLITGASGTVEQAIQKFKKGMFKTTDQANTAPHSGLNQ